MKCIYFLSLIPNILSGYPSLRVFLCRGFESCYLPRFLVSGSWFLLLATVTVGLSASRIISSLRLSIWMTDCASHLRLFGCSCLLLIAMPNGRYFTLHFALSVVCVRPMVYKRVAWSLFRGLCLSFCLFICRYCLPPNMRPLLWARASLARDLADSHGNCFEQCFLSVLDAKLGKQI